MKKHSPTSPNEDPTEMEAEKKLSGAENDTGAEHQAQADAKKELISLEPGNLFHKDPGNRILYFSLGLRKAKDLGLKIPDEVDYYNCQILEFEIYNFIRKEFDKLENSNYDIYSLNDALAQLEDRISHIALSPAGLMGQKIKDEKFFSELGLLLAYCYEIDDVQSRIVKIYEETGHLDKCKDSVIRLIKRVNANFDETSFDFEKERREGFPTVRRSKEKLSEIRDQKYDQDPDAYDQERLTRGSDLKEKLKIFLQKFPEKMAIDKEQAIKSIRKMLKKL